jgi:hypothetical protein
MLTFLQLGHLGRLGNQMFQIATTIGIARRFGYDFAFPYWKDHEHHHSDGAPIEALRDDIDVQAYFKKKLPVLPSEMSFDNFQHVQLPFHFDQTFVKDNTNFKNCCPQTEKYFKHYETEIREYFEFDTEYLFPMLYRPQMINALRVLSIGGSTCGIHLRAGDYLTKTDYHPVQPKEYYLKAMDLMPENTTFVVFSDDISRAKEMLEYTERKVIFMEGNHYMIDMWLMTRLDNFIICNSSFSWWGAWLIKNPDKKVIAPKNWFGPEATDVSAKDVYAEGWIVM